MIKEGCFAGVSKMLKSFNKGMFVVCQLGVIVNNLVGGILYGGRDSPNA